MEEEGGKESLRCWISAPISGMSSARERLDIGESEHEPGHLPAHLPDQRQDLSAFNQTPTENATLEFLHNVPSEAEGRGFRVHLKVVVLVLFVRGVVRVEK